VSICRVCHSGSVSESEGPAFSAGLPRVGYFQKIRLMSDRKQSTWGTPFVTSPSVLSVMHSLKGMGIPHAVVLTVVVSSVFIISFCCCLEGPCPGEGLQASTIRIPSDPGHRFSFSFNLVIDSVFLLISLFFELMYSSQLELGLVVCKARCADSWLA
jgi:hypothetical protein